MAKVGRPLKFSSPEELQKKIDKYFDWCDSRTRPKYITTRLGTEIIDEPWPRPYTIEGLAVALDTCRDTLCEYEKKTQFSDIITRAKNKILANKVEGGLDGSLNARMAEFMMRVNYKYNDKSEDDHDINVNIIRKVKPAPTEDNG